jgi:hypothetical protein
MKERQSVMHRGRWNQTKGRAQAKIYIWLLAILSAALFLTVYVKTSSGWLARIFMEEANYTMAADRMNQRVFTFTNRTILLFYNLSKW